ncbi:hypothetical protein JCM6882_000939 [Rhodosporidiobolus microsporus]
MPPPPPLHPSLPPRPLSSAAAPSSAGNFNAPLHGRPVPGTSGSAAQAGQYGQGGAAKSREGTPARHLPPHPNGPGGGGATRPGGGPPVGGSPRLGGGASSAFPGSPFNTAGGASPKPGGGAGTAAADSDPFAALPPRLKPEDLKPAFALVELGEGWKVHWRAWKGPALLFSPSSSSSAPNSATAAAPGPSSPPPPPEALYDYDPFLPSPHAPSPFAHLVPRPPLSSSISTAAAAAVGSPALGGSLSAALTPDAGTPTSSTAGQPPAKKAKKSSASTLASTGTGTVKMTAFEEMLAEEDGGGGEADHPAPPKKKGRVPKAVREAQAAAAAAAASPAASTPGPSVPGALDLPSPNGLSASTSSAAPPPPPFAGGGGAEAGPSVARLVRERLSSLPSSSSSPSSSANPSSLDDPILRAQRDVARLAATLAAAEDDEEEEEEGATRAKNADRLGLFAWVKVAPVRIGSGGGGAKESEKGKGKEREKRRMGDEGVGGEREKGEKGEVGVEGEAEGRTLWVFCVERGWEGEEGGVAERRRGLGELRFEGLESLASGTFSHSSLFPTLYPTASSSSSSSSSSGFTPPLSFPARSYPSCLALSSQVFTVPSISHPFPPQTHLQAAHDAFREGVREAVLDEMVAVSASSSSASSSSLAQAGERAVKLGDSIVYLPPPPLPSFGPLSLPSAAALAVKCTLLPPTLNRTALVLQPSVEEVPYAALTRKRTRRGEKVVLAPAGVRAVARRELGDLEEAQEAKLREEWGAHLGAELDEDEGWVLCALDLPASPSGREKHEANRPVEVVWPRSLVLLDRSPARRASSSSRSRSRSRNRAENGANAGGGDAEASSSDVDESSSSPETTPETRPTSLPPSPTAAFSYPSPLSPARTPLRPPYDAAFRRRLASQALQNVTGGGGRHRRRRSRSTVVGGEAMDEDDLAREREEEGYRDPIRRRTGEVWRWMGEEVRRREDEAEREKERERAREREKERAVAEEAKATSAAGSPEKKARQVPPPPPPPPASTSQQHQQQSFQPPPPPTSGPAAPINMRTPMSLGTASTEAPSPAELFSSLGYGGGGVSVAGGYHPHPTATPSSTAAPHAAHLPMQMDATDLLDGLGVYPSPAEAQPVASTSAAPPVTTGMSTLDAAFSAFDWGDGTFGAGTTTTAAGAGGAGGAGGAAGGGGDFDDGLMLGLTDDDFSFFDEPAAGPGGLPAASLPMSMPFDLSGLHDHAHDPHANPLDAFSVSVAPPVSTSPSAIAPFSFVAPFDNALGLSAAGSSAAPPAPTTILPVSGSTPPATVTTQMYPQLPPYSPSILQLPNFAPSSTAFPFMPLTPGPTAIPTVSLSPSFAAATSASSSSFFSASSSSFFSASSFDPIPFAPSHAQADEKYDPRKGKFGLPSPESDDGVGEPQQEGNLLVLLPAAAGRRRDERKKQDAGAESWFEAVCDPRLALAERLRLARRKSSGSSTSAGEKRGKDGVVRARGWVRPLRQSKALLALPPPPFQGEGDGEMTTGHNTADEAEPSDEEESGSEDSGGFSGAEDGMIVGGEEGRGEDGVRRRAKGDARVSNSLGASLLLLGPSFNGVLQRTLPSRSEGQDEAKPASTLVIDQAKEVMLSILAEQFIFNAEFRRATRAMSVANATSDSLVPSHAVSLASAALFRTCTSLSPPSLFSEDTPIPSLRLAESPAFLLRTQQCIAQTNRTAVDFWRPMGFEPLAGGKDITAFAVYEDDGAEMHETVKAWLSSLSGAYQSLRLGEHALGTVAPSGSFSGVQDGLIPLPAGLLTEPHGRDELKLLYATLAEHAKTTQNTVVYILSPFADSPLSPASPIAGILHQINKSRSPLVNILSCPVHLDSVAAYHPSLGHASEVDRLVRLAFTVYDQLQIPVSRLRIPAPETFPTARPAPTNALGPAVRIFQAPAVFLAPSPSKSPQVQFSLSWPAASLEVEQRHRLLHICYGSKPVVAGDSSQEWLAVTQIDDRGETWRTIPRYLKIPGNVVPDVHRVRVVWSFTKALVDATDVEWRVVVCKLGEPTAVEAKAWDSLLKEHLAVSKRPLHVTVTSVDFDPPFAVSQAPAPSRRGSATSTISEEGELSLTLAGKPLNPSNGKVTLFDNHPSSFTFSPSEPVSLVSFPVLAPSTTYFIHVPRIPTLTHTRVDRFHSSSGSGPEPVSVHALHFLLSHASRTSSYTGTLGALVDDVRQSYTELAALGQARWGTSGRLSWHIEGAMQALETAVQFGNAAAGNGHPQYPSA